ncbi:MAG: hypothetical protein IPL92_18040 [Saprospiraceae bacterium]|nr:hypothetical protein [Candidatus Opimibacter iunctus]
MLCLLCDDAATRPEDDRTGATVCAVPLLDSSEYLKPSDPPHSLSLALEALDWLPEKGYEEMKVFAYLRAANAEKIASHKTKSLEYVNQANALSSAIQDSSLMMRSAFM